MFSPRGICSENMFFPDVRRINDELSYKNNIHVHKATAEKSYYFLLLDMSNKQEKNATVENYTTIEMINLKIYHKIQTYGISFC